MAKCYYCSGTDKFCSECKRAAAAKVTPPSPNEVKPPVAEKKAADITAAQVARANDFVREINEKAKATPKKMYGWFSKQSMNYNRGSIYSRPDGSEVLVSFVNDDPNDHRTGWKDCKFIGEVVDWIRKG